MSRSSYTQHENDWFRLLLVVVVVAVIIILFMISCTTPRRTCGAHGETRYYQSKDINTLPAPKQKQPAI